MSDSGAPVPAVLVELAGPPGAGKSTLFQELVRRTPQLERRPALGHPRYAPLLARHLVSAAGTLVRQRRIERLTREQLRTMAYLRALPRVLARRYAGSTIVCDQGPLYLLARPALTDRRLAEWSAETFEMYARLLDLVVWLDGPDRILAERIAMRPTPHRLKEASLDAAAAVLAAARADFAPMLVALEEAPTPVVLRFDTSATSVGEVADGVVEALARVRSLATLG